MSANLPKMLGRAAPLLLAVGFPGFAIAQSVPTAPLWGGYTTNNNNDTKLFKDYANQIAICQDRDTFERENAQWAQIADSGACYVLNPQPSKKFCWERCNWGNAGA